MWEKGRWGGEMDCVWGEEMIVYGGVWEWEGEVGGGQGRSVWRWGDEGGRERMALVVRFWLFGRMGYMDSKSHRYGFRCRGCSLFYCPRSTSFLSGYSSSSWMLIRLSCCFDPFDP